MILYAGYDGLPSNVLPFLKTVKKPDKQFNVFKIISDRLFHKITSKYDSEMT